MELDYIDNSFRKFSDYQDVVVKLTPHNEAYYNRRKKGYGRIYVYERVSVIGEISLKDFANRGGCLKDKHQYD